MPLETGTFVNDLVITNPPGTDLKSQGDDHLQLIKKVLKNTFPNGSKAFYLPTSSGIAVNTTLSATDMNKFIFVDTTAGPITITMPSLVSADEGWSVILIKNLTANPIFIAPPSGNIISGGAVVAKARRHIPFTPFRVFWTSGNWWCERMVREPVGCVIPFFGVALPMGFEWPNGQTLTSASTNYPEYDALIGTIWGASGATPDLRERMLAGSDMTLGSPNLISAAAGRSGITPNLGQIGGFDIATLVQANLPNVTLSASGTVGFTSTGSIDSGGTASVSGNINANTGTNPGGSVPGLGTGGVGSTFPSGTLSGSISGNVTVSGSGSLSGGATSSINGNVTQTNVNKMPPTMICNYILVVE